MSTTTTTAKKIAAGIVSSAMALSFVFGGAIAPVQAQTAAELSNTISQLLATIAGLQAQLNTLSGSTTTTTTTGSGYVFTRNLSVGATGADVMELQKLLNMDAATIVATSGAGSKGNESSYFGPATKAAVIKFQNKYASEVLAPVGLTYGTGFFGSSSRAKANMMTGSVVTPGTTTPGTTPVVTGPVSASVASDSPVSGYVIDGQATADLAHFTFSGNGTVTSLKLKRAGISDQNTLSNVYLYDGVNRITDGYSFNSASEIVINGLNIMVAGSKTISVKADASSTASNNSTIKIVLTSFTANGTAVTTNLSGSEMSLASGASLATGSLSANTVSAANVDAGISQFTFWSAPLQINTRAVQLKVANFRMIGSAPSDAISNIRLFVDGIDTGKVAMVQSITGTNYAVFDLSSAPLTLTTGSHTIDVRGTVEKGSNRTVQFSLQQAADLMITDPQVGVNLAVSGIPQTTAAGTITINTGSVTANLDSTFQSLTTVTGGASDVAIAKFKLHAYGEDVKFNTLQILPVLLGTTPGTGGLDNVAIYFNGSQVGSQQDWTSSALTFTPGSQMIAPAGMDSILEVRADIRTSTSTNYTAGTVSANLVVGSSNAQGESSKNTLSSPAVTGNLLTVQTGLLAVAKNNGYANSNIQPNTAGVKLASFTLQNQSSSEAVRLTSLIVSADAGTAALTDISALRTSVTSGSGATPQQPQTSNTFSVNQTLAAGQTITIDILADTGSATSGTFIPTLNVTSIGVTSNVSATSGAITGQTVTLGTGTIATPTLASASDIAQLIPAGMGGSVDGSTAVFTFVSTGGASTISELKFTDTSGTATSTYAKVGNVSAPFVGGVAYLTGLSIAVPQSASGITIPVKFSYPEVGISGVSSAGTSQVNLTYVKYSSGGTTSTLLPTVSAPTMTLVGSKPTVAVNTSSVSGLGLTSQNKIGEITVTADAKGSIRLNDIKFNVSSSGFTTVPTFTGAFLASGSTGTTAITGSSCGQGVAAASSQIIFCEFGTAGNTMASSTDVVGLESNLDLDGYTIGAGESKTFSLLATVSAANTGTNLAQISTSLNAAGFNWDDTASAQSAGDGVTASPSAGTNLTGSNITVGFPGGSYTIKQ